jgi:hypothetical protein
VSEPSGRYQRSASGMVGAMVATLLLIAVFVALRACSRTPLDVKPTRVDYRAAVHYLQQSGSRMVYPGSLPKGWIVTQVNDSAGKRAELGLSILTAGGEYIGFQQSPIPLPELITTYVDPHPISGTPVDLDGGVIRHWAVWTDSGGDTALAGRWRHESLLVFGSASRSDIELVADALTTRRL